VTPPRAGPPVDEAIGTVELSQQSAPRPVRDEMLAAFRALQQKRRNTDEPDLVLEVIVSDDGPGSLLSDMQRTAI
jgi:hypothetical protein